jgi:hypothetical protein
LPNSRHSTLDSQNKILKPYASFIHDAEQYFQEGQEVLLPQDTEKNNDDLETLRVQERIISRLSQVAELANKPNLFQRGSKSISNPFDSYGFMILFLSPQFIPRLHGREIKQLTQSCLPNIVVDVHQTTDNRKDLKLQFIANRNIYEQEELTINILKDINPISENEIERTFRLAPPIEMLGIRVPDEEGDLDDGILNSMSVLRCSCLACQNDHKSVSLLIDRLSSSSLVNLINNIIIIHPTSLSLNANRKRQKLTLSGNAWNGKEETLLNELIREFHNNAETLLNAIKSPCLTATDSNIGFNFHKLHELQLLADEYMIKDGLFSGMIYYLLIALDIFHLFSVSDKITASFANWFSDICLSLGMSILEYFFKFYHAERMNASSTRKLPERLSLLSWTIEDILIIFEIGTTMLEIIPIEYVSKKRSSLVHELKKKLEDYRLLWEEYDLPLNTANMIDSFTTIVSNGIYHSAPTAILTPKECDFIITEAEHYSKQNENGWTTSRHYTVPTTDIPLSSITTISSWFIHDIFQKRIKQMLQNQFYPDSKQLKIIVNDLFVVKYHIHDDDDDEGNGDDQGKSVQRYLPIHSDQSTHSFVIALNQPEIDFHGGGTFFVNLQEKSNSSVNVVNPGTFYLYIAFFFFGLLTLVS